MNKASAQSPQAKVDWKTVLTQDYIDDGQGGHREVTAYRTVLAVRDAGGSPMQATLNVWTPEDVTLFANGQPVRVNTQNPASVGTDPLGQVVVVLPVEENADAPTALTAPKLFVHADFMGDRVDPLVISPDEQVHRKLATVQGAQMRTDTTQKPALLKPETISDKDARVIAKTVSALMSMALAQEKKTSGGKKCH